MAKKAVRKTVKKVPPARASRSAASKRLVAPPGGVVVRMYRQGLGDCFLLAFGPPKRQSRRAGPGEARYVLIDCGVHKRQDNGTNRLAVVMKDVMEATGNHLHVVVATHEHADHLSGFVQKGSPFLTSGVKIDQLWVAWTEQRGDKLANKLRQKHGTQRSVIEKAIKKLKQMEPPAGLAGADRQPNEWTLLRKRLQTLAGFEELPDELGDGASDQDDADIDAATHLIQAMKDQPDRVGRGLSRLLSAQTAPATGLGAAAASGAKPSSNELALGVLQATADVVKYCRPGDDLEIDPALSLRVHILGPPHDEAMLKKDLPSKIKGADTNGEKFKEVYLSGFGGALALDRCPALSDAAATDAGSADWQYPFDKHWSWPIDHSQGAANHTQADGRKNDVAERYLAQEHEWRRIDGDWLGAASDLALNLDSDTNNTSLVLAFDWNGKVLLFCGDAQVGNWLSWSDQKYLDKHGNPTMTVDDLFARTLLYKVGHHGSHNATLKRDPRSATDDHPLGRPYGLELMRDIIACIPVDRAAAEKNMPGPWEMPHLPLYERLREKSHRRVLRADAVTNIRPLAESEPKDNFPESSRFSRVPNLTGALWRQSALKFPTTNDPVYYEIEMAPT